MQTITLPIELVNRILDFLSQQPFRNVATMINDIQKAANPPTPSVEPIKVPEKKSNGPRRVEAEALD